MAAARRKTFLPFESGVNPQVLHSGAGNVSKGRRGRVNFATFRAPWLRSRAVHFSEGGLAGRLPFPRSASSRSMCWKRIRIAAALRSALPPGRFHPPARIRHREHRRSPARARNPLGHAAFHRLRQLVPLPRELLASHGPGRPAIVAAGAGLSSVSRSAPPGPAPQGNRNAPDAIAGTRPFACARPP